MVLHKLQWCLCNYSFPWSLSKKEIKFELSFEKWHLCGCYMQSFQIIKPSSRICHPRKEKKDPKKERWFFKINTSLVGLLIKLLLLCWKNNSYLETTIFIWTNLLFIFPKIYGWRLQFVTRRKQRWKCIKGETISAHFTLWHEL